MGPARDPYVVLFMLDMKLLKSTRPSGIRQAILIVFLTCWSLIDQTFDMEVVGPAKSGSWHH